MPLTGDKCTVYDPSRFTSVFLRFVILVVLYTALSNLEVGQS